MVDESWWKNHDPNSLTHHFLKSPFNPHQPLTVSFVIAWAWVPSISNELLPLRKWCVKRRQTMRRERGKSQQRCGLEHSVLDDGVLKCYVNMWVFCTVIFWHVFFPFELFILFYFKFLFTWTDILCFLFKLFERWFQYHVYIYIYTVFGCWWLLFGLCSQQAVLTTHNTKGDVRMHSRKIFRPAFSGDSVHKGSTKASIGSAAIWKSLSSGYSAYVPWNFVIAWTWRRIRHVRC